MFRMLPTDQCFNTDDLSICEDPAARLDADFALVTAELSQFIPALFNALGGEEAPL